MLARPIGHMAFTQVLLPQCFELAWKGQAQICQASYGTKITDRYVSGPVNEEGKERDMMRIQRNILMAMAMALFVVGSALGQVCHISYETKNRDRKVPGPVNEECGLSGGEVNSAPFGNWGVETETSARKDGYQFAGWCREKYVCDNEGECKRACRDRWYEWNSCTSSVARFRPPNDTLYNYANSTQQQSAGTASQNTHGSGVLSLTVSCPVDTDGDYYPNEGGCTDALDNGFTLRGHRMELWELDHWRPWDDHIGTMHFPTLTASGSGTNCDVYGCDGGTTGSFRSKLRGTSAVSASAAVRVSGALFEDEYGLCCDPLEDPTCD